MRALALLAIIWALGWLLLVVLPTGDVNAVDRGYDLMFVPFKLPANAGLLLRRLVEFVCLLPAAAFLLSAQAVQRRRISRDRAQR